MSAADSKERKEPNTQEKDDFWTLERLMPTPSRPHRMASHTADTEAVEVILTAHESTPDDTFSPIEMRPADTSSRKLTIPPHPSAPPTAEADEVYDLPFPMIHRVSVFRRHDFAYYKAFQEDGQRLLREEGRRCEAVPYFSYVPQYSQLSPGQMAYYCYIREQWRAGVFPRVDYSYLLLYVFELLNVEPDREAAARMLARLWVQYRASYPKLESLLCEWLTDYCLLYRLYPPLAELEPVKAYIKGNAALKELFLPPQEEAMQMAEMIMDLCSNYDYRKSKFATPEHLPLYRDCMAGAVREVLTHYQNGAQPLTGQATLRREAFAGALCTPAIKCRLDVTYHSFSRSHEMRFLITDAIKHTENRIRAYLGIKSRLTVYSLPIEVRRLLDAYMDGVLAARRPLPKREEAQAYDALYDVPTHTFSLSRAMEIEAMSWQTTQKLVETFAEEPESDVMTDSRPDARPISETAVSQPPTSDEEALVQAMQPYRAFLRAALAGDVAGQASAAEALHKLPDSLADEINECAAEIYGDIILEKQDRGYAVIEEYTEVLRHV